MEIRYETKKGMSGEWQAGFTIGNQTFFLEENGDKEHAEWFVEMLKIAFANLEVYMESIYTYKGKEYKIVHFVKMKVNGEWVAGVLYEAMYLNPDGRYFVRTKEEFDLLFSLKK